MGPTEKRHSPNYPYVRSRVKQKRSSNNPKTHPTNQTKTTTPNTEPKLINSIIILRGFLHYQDQANEQRHNTGKSEFEMEDTYSSTITFLNKNNLNLFNFRKLNIFTHSKQANLTFKKFFGLKFFFPFFTTLNFVKFISHFFNSS